MDYDGATLKFELTAPAQAELALRLSRRPERATLDGEPAAIQEDAARHLYLVKIAPGAAPSFLRLEIAYPREGLRVTIEPREPWIAGDARAVRVRVENPLPTALEGDLDLLAGSFSPRGKPSAARERSGEVPPRIQLSLSRYLFRPRLTNLSKSLQRCIRAVLPPPGRRVCR